MSKIKNDKYYTPVNIANHCIDKVLEYIGEDNISEVVEPSVGDGAFLHHPKLFVHFGYDIEPECTSDCSHILKKDYLTAHIPYLQGRLIIGNPPFGDRMNMAQKFYKKAVTEADYIAFILPISQLNNTHSLYEFDLIHSEDLGIVNFSDRDLHCCFNIYRIPAGGDINKKPKNRLKDISIYRQDSNGYDSREFDIRMCYWGDGTAGNILKDDEHYSAEYKIKIHNNELRQNIVEYLTTFNWKDYLSCISARKIHQFQIIKILSDRFPTLR